MDMVEICHFNFRDEARWKAMSVDAIQSVCARGVSPNWPTLPPLCASTLDAGLISNDLEHELRALIMEHRRVTLEHLFNF